MYPSETENDIFSTLLSSMNDYTVLNSTIDILKESYPDFPVVKFLFHRFTRLNLSDTESQSLFNNIIKHCASLSNKLEKKINFYMGMVDYFIERNRIILNPVFVDLCISENIDNNSYKDPLTSAYNKNFLEKIITSEISRSKRYGETFSMMMIDIDHFSMINSHYGYHAGNDVLIEFVERIQKDMRAEDTLVRYFDDRFILTLPHTDKKGAQEFGERILSNFVKDLFQIENRIININLNIGIAVYAQHGDNIDDLLKSLSKARYKSKEMGGGSIAYPDE